jgi:hypothetical protein
MPSLDPVRRGKASVTPTSWHCLTILGPILALARPAGEALAQGPERGVSVVEKRVALVIGNGAYATAPLRNPVNDARAMAQTLRGLGFDVIARENLGQIEMRRAMLEFGRRLLDGGVGLFYYRGGEVGVRCARRAP